MPSNKQYEYKTVALGRELDKAAQAGWRVVPGIVVSGDFVLVERVRRFEEDYMTDEEVLAKRALAFCPVCGQTMKRSETNTHRCVGP